MCGESIELVFDNWQCIVNRAVINNDKIVSMIFVRNYQILSQVWSLQFASL
jgi:hypothetical protein